MHLPPSFDASTKHAAIIVGHPITGVKEQTAGTYAQFLASQGFVALAYDACYQGESGGEPRFMEDPAARVEDFHCAIDYLVAQGFVDATRIGVLGICGSGGYAATAAMTDHRIAALATVSGACYGRVLRVGGLGGPSGLALAALIDAQRSAEATGAPGMAPQIIPEQADAPQVGDLKLASDYYRTPRAGHERAPNRIAFARQQAALGYDAFDLAEQLLTQPLLIIVGAVPGGLGSLRDGWRLYEKAASSEKDILEVEGANHFDLYDQPQAVTQACDALGAFVAKHVPAAH